MFENLNPKSNAHRDDIFGEPIFVYTSEQAVEDGVLVHPYPEQWPWLLVTQTVFVLCEREATKSRRTLDQVLVPLLNDVILKVKSVKGSLQDACPLVLRHTATDEIWIGLNEKGGLTVMKPEDY